MARDLNTAAVVGRLGKEPELKQTKNGKDVVDFSIANNRSWGKDERTNWIRCRAYGPVAKAVVGYVRKGKRVALSGELTFDRWQDQNNNWQERTYLLVTELEIIDWDDSTKPNNTQQPDNQINYVNKEYESYEPYEADYGASDYEF